MMTDHTIYQSPFTWRYTSDEMRHVFSEIHRRKLWRRIWVALARAQASLDLVSAEQLADIEAHAEAVDIERALEIEEIVRHDVMAEIKTFAEQCEIGGGVIHLGATSMDVLDNAEILRQREALDLVLDKLRELIGLFVDLVERYADMPVMGYTHIQPAEPTTLGYRFAQTLQDLLVDWEEISRVRGKLKGKGLKAAVGTMASYQQLLVGTGSTAGEFEQLVLADLGLQAFTATTQTYPRKQDWLLLNALAGLAQSLYRFAFDLRILQSPLFGELSELFGKGQVGSSAMPFKRNPITAEKIDSIARHIATLPNVAWHNAAHSLLERTLDDSANRRSIIPDAFLATDELLISATRIVSDLNIWPDAIARNLKTYGVFAASERLLMEAVKAGGDRQHLHEVIREHSLTAWAAVQHGDPNPLSDLLASDPEFTSLLASDDIISLLDASDYVGEAPQRAHEMAALARKNLQHTNMIRILHSDDYDQIYGFCDQNPALNLYFLGNLEALGVESDICQFWGSFDGEGHLTGVLMRYMDGWNITDGPGCDYHGLGQIVDEHPAGATRLQDNPRHTESLLPFLHRYLEQGTSTEYLCALDHQDFDPTCKPWPTRRAAMSDYDALRHFYAHAEHMTRTPRGVERPLQDGRVFIVEVENQIVSSVLTNAETKTLAMIGGVYTPPAHRGNGYASTAMVALCHSLIADHIRPVLYYDNPAAGGIYRRLGFNDLGLWKSMHLVYRE